jgi:hypothetical protein
MIRIFHATKSSLRSTRAEASTGRNVPARVLHLDRKKCKISRGESGSANIALLGIGVFFLLAAFVAGAVYLYQVNDLATKGFEVQDLNSRIGTLAKEQKKMQIREVELRSMYHLEQSVNDLNLVNTKDVTYLELSSPVAMK